MVRNLSNLFVLGMALHQALPVPFDLLHPDTNIGRVTRESGYQQYYTAFALDLYQAFFGAVQMRAPSTQSGPLNMLSLFQDPYHPVQQVLLHPDYPPTPPSHPNMPSYPTPSQPDDVVWFTPHRACPTFMAACAARNGYAFRMPEMPTPVTPESSAEAQALLEALSTAASPDTLTTQEV
jgi:hypothetical protein